MMGLPEACRLPRGHRAGSNLRHRRVHEPGRLRQHSAVGLSVPAINGVVRGTAKRPDGQVESGRRKGHEKESITTHEPGLDR